MYKTILADKTITGYVCKGDLGLRIYTGNMIPDNVIKKIRVTIPDGFQVHRLYKGDFGVEDYIVKTETDMVYGLVYIGKDLYMETYGDQVKIAAGNIKTGSVAQ